MIGHHIGTMYASIAMDSTRLSRDAKKAGKTVNGLDKDFRGLRSTVLSTQNVFAGLGGYMAMQFAKDLWKTAVMVDQVNRAFMVIASGGGGLYNARRELNYIRETAMELGQEFWSLTDSFKFIAAAAKDTALEGQGTRDIFRAVSEAGTALGLTNVQVKMSLYAISQMISKGTVNAEELRQQLGERLPGAYQAMARALGVTTKELNKMLEQGQVISTEAIPKLAKELSRLYAGPAMLAANKPIGILNRFKTAWIDLKEELSSGMFLDVATDALINLTELFKDEEFKEGMEDLVGALSLLTRDFVTILTWGAKVTAFFSTDLPEALQKTQDSLLFPAHEMAKSYGNAVKAIEDLIYVLKTADYGKIADDIGKFFEDVTWDLFPEERYQITRDRIQKLKDQAIIDSGGLYGADTDLGLFHERYKEIERLQKLIQRQDPSYSLHKKKYDLTGIEPPVPFDWRGPERTMQRGEYDLDFDAADIRLNWSMPEDKKAIKELEKWEYKLEDYRKMFSETIDPQEADWFGGIPEDLKKQQDYWNDIAKAMHDLATERKELLEGLERDIKFDGLEGVERDIARVREQFAELRKEIGGGIFYGRRQDGELKGPGWLGEILDSKGNIMTEYSIGVEFDGKKMDIPSLVPGLTKDEIESIKNQEVTPEIIEKAVSHAKSRMEKGLSPFLDFKDEALKLAQLEAQAIANIETAYGKEREKAFGELQKQFKISTLEGLDLELFNIDEEFNKYIDQVPVDKLDELEKMRNQMKQMARIEFQFEIDMDYQNTISQFEDLARNVQDIADSINFDADYGVDEQAVIEHKAYRERLKAAREYEMARRNAIEDHVDFWQIKEQEKTEVTARHLEYMEQMYEDSLWGRMTKLTLNTAEKMEDNFSNVFFDAVKGELESFEDYARAIFDSISRAWADMMGQMLAKSIFGADGQGGGLLDAGIDFLKSLGVKAAGSGIGTGMSGAGGADPTGMGSLFADYSMAGGGYLGERIIGKGTSSGKSYEFHPNEAVLPLNRMNGDGEAPQPIQNNINLTIKAMDSRDVTKVLSENKGLIGNLVGGQMMRDQSLRSNVKIAAR